MRQRRGGESDRQREGEKEGGEGEDSLRVSVRPRPMCFTCSQLLDCASYVAKSAYDCYFYVTYSDVQHLLHCADQEKTIIFFLFIIFTVSCTPLQFQTLNLNP